MEWRDRAKGLLSKVSSPGWVILAVSILGWLGDAATALSLPNMVMGIWNWLESPWGYWTMLGFGLAWITRLLIWPPAHSRPSLEKLSRQVAIIQQKVDMLWQGVSVPYTRVEFLSLEFRAKRRLRVHFRVDTDIANQEVVKVVLDISNEPIEAIDWKPFRIDKTQTGIASFRLPDIYTKGEYSATLKVYRQFQYPNGETSELDELATSPFQIRVP